ncbi:MAG: hypothetical protein OK438_04215 [Thaumarchaeota archaeon]|nr:hypothetical protein [Nitrososphaerota archaeon]
MKATVAVLGVVVLLIGVGLVAYGVTSPLSQTSQKTTTVHTVVTPKTTRSIDAFGIWAPAAAVLTKGEVVTGTFTISNYSSSVGPIFMYAQSISQFIAWGNCAPCASPSLDNWTLPSSGTYTVTWTVPNNGSFYVSFDNEYYNAVAPAVYAANGTTTSTTNIITTTPNTTYIDLGAGLIIVGAIVIAAGVIMQGSAKKKAMQ